MKPIFEIQNGHFKKKKRMKQIFQRKYMFFVFFKEKFTRKLFKIMKAIKYSYLKSMNNCILWCCLLKVVRKMI